MAVVFISPKKRQRAFLLGIAALLLLFLAVIFFGVFLSQPKDIQTALTFNKPKVNVDMQIFDSQQFKDLQPVSPMQIQYSYTASDQNNQPKTGFISAISMDDAKNTLQGMGLTVTDIKEAEIGRDNPFEPYYQPAAAPSPAPKVPAKK